MCPARAAPPCRASMRPGSTAAAATLIGADWNVADAGARIAVVGVLALVTRVAGPARSSGLGPLPLLTNTFAGRVAAACSSRGEPRRGSRTAKRDRYGPL